MFLHKRKSPVLLRSSAAASVASFRCKSAPLPPALEAPSRRPTRPSLHIPGRSASRDPATPPDGGESSETEDMDIHSSLTRKQESRSKKGGPKKGKH